MEGTDLPRQYALAESPVTRPQHRPPVRTELHGDTEPRRHDVPGVQRPETFYDVVRFAPFTIDRVEVLTNRAAVIETQAGIDRQLVPQGDGIARERGGGDGQSSVVRGIPR